MRQNSEPWCIMNCLQFAYKWIVGKIFHHLLVIDLKKKIGCSNAAKKIFLRNTIRPERESIVTLIFLICHCQWVRKGTISETTCLWMLLKISIVCAINVMQSELASVMSLEGLHYSCIQKFEHCCYVRMKCFAVVTVKLYVKRNGGVWWERYLPLF